MFNKIVIDSSAIIAFLDLEPGSENVREHLNDAIISTINLAEVITVINRKTGGDKEAQAEALMLLKNTFAHIIDFDLEQAIIAAEIDLVSKKYGLSLGDRACLALAKAKKLPVLTADKEWKKLKIGVDVQLVR